MSGWVASSVGSTGGRVPPEEDYGPEWYIVAQLERGKSQRDHDSGGVFDAKPWKAPSVTSV